MKILQIGFFPPPVHGMSFVNQRVYNFFTEKGLEVHKVCSGFIPKTSSNKGIVFLLGRIRNFLIVLFTITYFFIKNRKERVVAYVTPSGGSGLIFDLCICWLLVKLNVSAIIYHHHSFSYLTQASNIIQKIARFSNNSYHIFLCNSMKGAFLEVYGSEFEGRTFTVGNAWCLNPTRVSIDSDQKNATEICLGHLSNLCQEKGLHTVVSIFEKLVQKGKLVKLHLAGPASDSDKVFIQSLIARYEHLVYWSGPVYELNKQKWYESIDVFLFPSRYINEAQPMVILEAMSYGCTVIATQRGCIPEMLVEGSGYAIAESEFEDVSVQFLERLIDDRDKLNMLKSNAYSRFKDMQALATSEMNHILSILHKV
jgi:glycosyltransferase involved in cell wall biosynthesis